MQWALAIPSSGGSSRVVVPPLLVTIRACSRSCLLRASRARGSPVRATVHAVWTMRLRSYGLHGDRRCRRCPPALPEEQTRDHRDKMTKPRRKTARCDTTRRRSGSDSRRETAQLCHSAATKHIDRTLIALTAVANVDKWSTRLSQYYLVKDASKELSSRPLCEQALMMNA